MLSSVSIHLYVIHDYKSIIGAVQDVEPQVNDHISNIVSQQVVDWLCIDDICGTFTSYAPSTSCNSIHWNYIYWLTSSSNSKLFQLLFPSINILSLSVFNADTPQVNFRGMDSMYISHHCGIVADWNVTMMDIINELIQSCTLFHFSTLWIPAHTCYGPSLKSTESISNTLQ